MSFNEFLKKSIENYDSIVDYYLNYLMDFSKNEFPFEEQIQLRGAADKFMNTICEVSYLDKSIIDQYFELIDNFREDLRVYRRAKGISNFLRLFSPTRVIKINQIRDAFEVIYSRSLELLNECNKQRQYRSEGIKLNGFYQPENSNKAKIEELVNEAIVLIEEDSTLTTDSKKQLVEYLNIVLRDLKGEYSDWTKIIGRIKETIIILGAMGSIMGGIAPLFDAKKKLEDTTTIIENTSINLNYNVVNKTFNCHDIQQLENVSSVLLQIEEGEEK